MTLCFLINLNLKIYFFDDTQTYVDVTKLGGINSFLYKTVEQVKILK